MERAGERRREKEREGERRREKRYTEIYGERRGEKGREGERRREKRSSSEVGRESGGEQIHTDKTTDTDEGGGGGNACQRAGTLESRRGEIYSHSGW